MRILHTADWHLGKRLMEAQRYEEFALFLDWLIEQIKDAKVDVLIVAGDIFDTMTPSNKAQELYYGFLGRLAQTGCQHAVIVAGNHDSPSFLDAPKHLFRHFNIHVVGTISETLQDEVLLLKNHANEPLAIVAAIPYLRDRDVRKAQLYDSVEDKEWATLTGIHQHYQAVYEACLSLKEEIQAQTGRTLPMIATGHLFAAGAMPAAKDDGMRELYVGSLGQVGYEIFCGFDYVALGHIHKEQMVAKQSHIRYSGSPMAFCFDEANQDKKVLLIEFNHQQTPQISALTVPVFRILKPLHGTLSEIQAAITKLKAQPHTRCVWLDILLTDSVQEPNLAAKIYEWIGDAPLMALRIRQTQLKTSSLTHPLERTLTELNPKDVFLSLLEQLYDPSSTSKITLEDTQKEQLIHAYDTVLYELVHEDKMAT